MSCRSPYRFLTEEEYYQSPLRDVGYSGIFWAFVNNTSSHGVPHLHHARGPVKVFYWLTITVLALVLLSIMGKDLFVMFFKYDVNVKVTMETVPILRFPAVTVCNHNAIRESMIAQSTEISDLMAALDEHQDGGNSTSNITFGAGTSGSRKQDAEYEFQMRVQEILAAMDTTQKMDFGHTAENLILDCKYNGYVCDYSEFFPFYDSNYGNCYVFNWGKDEQVAENSYRPGATHGLSIVFNLEQAEYIGEMTEAAGLRVVVHPQENMPFPGDEGISVSPGQLTFVAVRKLTVERYPYKHGKIACTKVTSNTMQNVYEELYQVGYTSKACLQTCYQRTLMAECGCGDSNFPMDGAAFGNKSYEPCSSFDADQEDCGAIVRELSSNGELDCDCPESCLDEIYQTVVSAARWPSDKYKPDLFTKLAEKGAAVENLLLSNDTTLYERSFGKMVVFFDQFNVEKITESPAYTLASLVSDLGGILGLFIGFSMLTIGEFVELLLDLFIYSCLKLCGRGGQPRRRWSVSPTPLPAHYLKTPHGYDSKQIQSLPS